MEQIRPRKEKRHRIFRDRVNGKFVDGVLTTKMVWVCEDTEQHVCGIGETPHAAYEDCWTQLEIMTSDIHQ